MENDIFVETLRLTLRKMNRDDLPQLKRILQDPDVMYAYEHAFSDEECDAWLNIQLNRYAQDGLGLFAVCLKDSGLLIGQCGLTYQQSNVKTQLEIGYLFNKDFWHMGYATEAAEACKAYAFDVLNLEEVVSIIRDNNFASQAVAKRLGMINRATIVKHYRNLDMPHIVFVVKNENL